jgi:hypothetical protein
MIMFFKSAGLLVTLGLLGCAPNVTSGVLSPSSQETFYVALARASGSVYLKGKDITSPGLVDALIAVSRRKVNVVVLLERTAPTNPTSRVNSLAKGLRYNPANVVFVAMGSNKIAPFALVNGQSFYGEGLLNETGEVQLGPPGKNLSDEISEFTNLPRRAYSGE